MDRSSGWEITHKSLHGLLVGIYNEDTSIGREQALRVYDVFKYRDIKWLFYLERNGMQTNNVLVVQ